jgi:hypothetical protein
MAKERPVTLEIENLEFKVFDADDIRKFSVCDVTNPISFDSIGNCTRGGLFTQFYNTLGSSSSNLACRSLRQPNGAVGASRAVWNVQQWSQRLHRPFWACGASHERL